MTALRLYTDGSCYPPGTVGGWAWMLVSEHPVASGSGKTPGPSNHQRCEVTAAIEGLTYLVGSGIREVELLSDSRRVVGGMSSTGCTGCKGWAHPAAERGWRDARAGSPSRILTSGSGSSNWPAASPSPGDTCPATGRRQTRATTPTTTARSMRWHWRPA